MLTIKTNIFLWDVLPSNEEIDKFREKHAPNKKKEQFRYFVWNENKLTFMKDFKENQIPAIFSLFKLHKEYQIEVTVFYKNKIIRLMAPHQNAIFAIDQFKELL